MLHITIASPMSLRELGVAGLTFVVTHFIVDRMSVDRLLALMGGAACVGVVFTVGASVGAGLGLMLADHVARQLGDRGLMDALTVKAQPAPPQ